MVAAADLLLLLLPMVTMNAEEIKFRPFITSTLLVMAQARAKARRRLKHQSAGDPYTECEAAL